MTLPNLNNLNDLTEHLANQEKRIRDLELANAALISEVKKRFVSKGELPEIISNSIPKSGLFSQSFLNRAFSVWGYYFIARLLISLILGLIFGLIYFILFITILKISFPLGFHL